MMYIKNKKYLVLLFLIFLFLSSCSNSKKDNKNKVKETTLKVHWFIPDGLRADPDLMNIFEWAQKGELPNIKKLMDNGSYGYSVPTFPGHTPTNFATLLTGSTPKTHGISDGPMRSGGYPLKMVSISGFSSTAKKVPPIWFTLEKEYNEKFALISVPGSTPPELYKGVIIRGRWGGWGVDLPAVIFHSDNDKKFKSSLGFASKIFYFGPDLTKFVPPQKMEDWDMDLPKSFSPGFEIVFDNWGAKIYGYVYDSKNDEIKEYDKILLSKDKKSVLTILGDGEWSNWLPLTIHWQTKNDYKITTPKKIGLERVLSSISVDTQVKVKVIKLGSKDSFRIRFFYNNLNKYLTRPASVSQEVVENVGPMVDFVDNYPPQLIYFPEDKSAFMEEADLSYDWHNRIIPFIIDKYKPSFLIHDIYTPNQVLSSKWWLGYIDPTSKKYNDISEEKRAELWREVKHMYKKIDEMIGTMIDTAEKDTLIILSSDHGMVPLNTFVQLNNLFARERLLSFSVNNETGEYEIDWDKSQVVFLKTSNVYVNPDGLGGSYRRASGRKYEALRDKVKNMILNLKDDNGSSPIGQVIKYEDASYLDLPKNRVGDLIVVVNPGYGLSEGMDYNKEIFMNSIRSGYKQAVDPRTNKGMWTPFIISGPNVKKDYAIKRPIRHIDQYPTILKLLGYSEPKFVEGSVIEEIIKNK